MSSEPDFRIGIDIGGTFTDFLIINERTGKITVEKSPSTPHDLWEGIRNGLRHANIDLARAWMVVHGTTVALNALLEKRGTPTGLITTRGFRDVYEIGRHNRVEMYDLFYQKPKPLVPRRHRLPVTERLDATGHVLVPLNRDDVVGAAEKFRNDDIKTIAVCLLHSYANPVHELAVGRILAEVYPEAMVSLSHHLAREWREYERTSTTVINAYVTERVSNYLDRVESGLTQRGYKRLFFVNQSSGGILPVRSARTTPVRTIMSGPAGGAVSTSAVGQSIGFQNIIGFDMGGTSTDVSLTYQGKIKITVESQIEGHPLMVPMVDIHSIGAGGGSVAWIDRSGALNVGPHSAGADPGPACYGLGGTEPSVTDANLILGRVLPRLLGGAMVLDSEMARQAVQKVAEPLGLDVEHAAAGIIRIVNTKMAYAIRAVTVQRGLDPKDFALLAFGGAGPMHACAIAAELDIPTIIIPVAPGAFSALGMLMSDIRHDYVRTQLVPTQAADPLRLQASFVEMEQEAARELSQELEPGMGIRLDRALEMRYVGQEYTVKVPLPSDPVTTELLVAMRHEFDRLHDQTYGHASEAELTEIIKLRLIAFGLLDPLKFETLPRGQNAPPRSAFVGTTHMYMDGGANFVDSPVYDREQLQSGNSLNGPALLTEKGATTVLMPGFECVVDSFGNLILKGGDVRGH